MVYESSPSLSELSSPRRSSSSTPTSAGQVAPAGYHYMPDGTLMSDEEHDRLYGVKSVVKLKKNNEVILARDIHTVEKEYEISLNKNTVNPLTYGDVKNISKDPKLPNISTIFRMNCIVEEIPVPKVNRVLGLSSPQKNLINTSYAIFEEYDETTERINIPTYENEDGNDVKYPYKYVNKNGVIINLTTTGDAGANYDLIVKDATNTKWYNWDTKVFESGYNSKQGVVDYKTLELVIPPSTSEVEYYIFFDSIGSTDYSSSLPTREKPWYICQLMDATTVFGFSNDDVNFIPETTVSKTYLPNTIINAEQSGAETDLTITVRPKRGKIKLIYDEVSKLKVDVNEFINSWSISPDRTSAFKANLFASGNSDYSIGTITGTITLHKSSLRDVNSIVNPNNFFKIV